MTSSIDSDRNPSSATTRRQLLEYSASLTAWGVTARPSPRYPRRGVCDGWGWFDPRRTVHLIGDTHFGELAPDRASALLEDVRALAGSAVAHLQVGDVTNVGTPDQDRLALAWLRPLPGHWYAIAGNHDVWNDRRTAKDFAAAFGNASSDFAVDRGFIEIVCLWYQQLHPVDHTTIWLSSDQLRWLDRALGRRSKDCVVACHAPLFDTVRGDESAMYTSTTAGFFVRAFGSKGRGEELRDILARHPRVKAWVSGHTHSPIDAPSLLKAEPIGSRTLAAIDCCALYYTGKSIDPTDDLITLYLTSYPDRLEVRYRDHRGRQWLSLSGASTWTLPLERATIVVPEGLC